MNDADLVAYIGRVHERTQEVVEAVPDALLGWRPRPGEFTTAELVLHIAATRRMNAASIGGAPLHYDGHEPDEGLTGEALRAALRRSSEEALASIEGVDLDQEIASITHGTFFGWQRLLGGLAEHEIHHRSQLCDYLGANGIAPPPLHGVHVEDLPRG